MLPFHSSSPRLYHDQRFLRIITSTNNDKQFLSSISEPQKHISVWSGASCNSCPIYKRERLWSLVCSRQFQPKLMSKFFVTHMPWPHNGLRIKTNYLNISHNWVNVVGHHRLSLGKHKSWSINTAEFCAKGCSLICLRSQIDYRTPARIIDTNLTTKQGSVVSYITVLWKVNPLLIERSPEHVNQTFIK